MKITSKQFQKLKAKWDKKLKDSGFDDIESGENNLKDWDSFRFQKLFTPTQFEENKRYWQLASQLLHEGLFEDAAEKTMWELYVNGRTLSQIGAALKVSSSTVSRTLTRINKLIKI